MRIIHNGYAITTYGKSSMSITDPDGKEIYHTNTFETTEEKDLKNYLKEFVKEEKKKNK